MEFRVLYLLRILRHLAINLDGFTQRKRFLVSKWQVSSPFHLDGVHTWVGIVGESSIDLNRPQVLTVQPNHGPGWGAGDHEGGGDDDFALQLHVELRLLIFKDIDWQLERLEPGFLQTDLVSCLRKRNPDVTGARRSREHEIVDEDGYIGLDGPQENPSDLGLLSRALDTRGRPTGRRSWGLEFRRGHGGSRELHITVGNAQPQQEKWQGNRQCSFHPALVRCPLPAQFRTSHIVIYPVVVEHLVIDAVADLQHAV